PVHLAPEELVRDARPRRATQRVRRARREEAIAAKPGETGKGSRSAELARDSVAFSGDFVEDGRAAGNVEESEVHVVTKVVPGLLIATPDVAQAAREAAGRMTKAIRDAIRDRGTATIALSGGSEPLDAYRLLASETIDWNKVHVYWVDERAVPPSHERSNYGAAKAALLEPARIPPANIHRMRGEASD